MLFYLKMKNTFIYIIIIVFIASSCKKKNKEIIITGTVINSVKSEQLNNVNVILSGKIIESNKWTNSYSKLASTNSDNNGKYTLKLDAVRVSEYKLSFIKENYIDETKIIQPDDISTDKENVVNADMYIKSFIDIKINNTNPVNQNDYMSLTLSGYFKNCTSCCTDEKFEFKGQEINQNIICICPGNQNIILNWDILKSGSVNSYKDTLFVGNIDTVNYIINY